MNVSATISEITILGHCSCPELFRETVRFFSNQTAAPGLSEEVPSPCSAKDSQDASGRIYCVMIPPVSPSLEKDFRELLQIIGNRRDIELSLNDWGSLWHCSALKERGELALGLTAGVLLSGQDTDPLLADFYKPQPSRMVYAGEEGNTPALAKWVPPGEALTEHWRTPSVFTVVPLLKKLGVTRLELSNQPLPLPETAPGLPVTLISEAVISVFPCRSNCSACQKYLTIKRGNEIIQRRRNLLLAAAQMQERSWIDRIITFFP